METKNKGQKQTKVKHEKDLKPKIKKGEDHCDGGFNISGRNRRRRKFKFTVSSYWERTFSDIRFIFRKG